MEEGEAFTVLFSKVTAGDIIKKKNQDFAFDMAGLWFFFIKGQRTEWQRTECSECLQKDSSGITNAVPP